MPKLPRITVRQFGASGVSTNFGQFGSKKAAAPQTSQDPSVIMSLAAWVNGWTQAAVGARFNPYLEDMNGFCLTVFYFLSNLFERGIPDWDTGTTYYQGALVNDPAVPGDVYVSLTNNNLGNAIPGHAGNAQWKWWNPSGSGSGLDADTVDGLHASATPAAGKLLALDGSAQFPASVFPGTVVQTVRSTINTPQTISSVIPGDNTKPQQTEGVEVITVTITPTNVNNKLRVRGVIPMTKQGTDWLVAALFRDGGADAIGVGVVWQDAVGSWFDVIVDNEVIAGALTPTTFKVRVGSFSGATVELFQYAGTPYFGGLWIASLTVDEIAV